MSKDKLRLLFEAMREAEAATNKTRRALIEADGKPEEFEADIAHHRALDHFNKARDTYNKAMDSFIAEGA